MESSKKTVTNDSKLFDALILKTPVYFSDTGCDGTPFARVEILCRDTCTGEVQDRTIPTEVFRSLLSLGEQLCRFTTPGTTWTFTVGARKEFYDAPSAKNPRNK